MKRCALFLLIASCTSFSGQDDKKPRNLRLGQFQHESPLAQKDKSRTCLPLKCAIRAAWHNWKYNCWGQKSYEEISDRNQPR